MHAIHKVKRQRHSDQCHHCETHHAHVHEFSRSAYTCSITMPEIVRATSSSLSATFSRWPKSSWPMMKAIGSFLALPFINAFKPFSCWRSDSSSMAIICLQSTSRRAALGPVSYTHL